MYLLYSHVLIYKCNNLCRPLEPETTGGSKESLSSSPKSPELIEDLEGTEWYINVTLRMIVTLLVLQ